MVTEIQMFETTDVTPLDTCGLDEELSMGRKRWIHKDELLARIWDAAARKNTCADQLRQ